jgi:hypothetical protein
MDDLRIGFYGLLIANIALGFLFGAFPLVAGIRTGNRKHGFLGFVLSVGGGALLGVLLSFPLAMIFLWQTLRDQATDPIATASQPAAGDPVV